MVLTFRGRSGIWTFLVVLGSGLSVLLCGCELFEVGSGFDFSWQVALWDFWWPVWGLHFQAGLEWPPKYQLELGPEAWAGKKLSARVVPKHLTKRPNVPKWTPKGIKWIPKGRQRIPRESKGSPRRSQMDPKGCECALSIFHMWGERC